MQTLIHMGYMHKSQLQFSLNDAKKLGVKAQTQKENEFDTD